MHRPAPPDPTAVPADPDAAAAGGSGAAAAAGTPPDRRTVRIGIGGPVGSGKTALIATLCRELADRWSVAVVTNDIYTTEDADRLRRDGVLDDDRIVAVRTGCCPHTAVRDDITANLDAVEGLEAAHPDLDLVLVESGGDNLTLTWSQALVDHEVFVIDVAAGDDIPRKGGPGVTRSDLLIVNKTDLAPYVRVDLDGMARDAEVARAGATTIFVSTVEDPSGAPVRDWVNTRLKARAAVAPA